MRSVCNPTIFSGRSKRSSTSELVGGAGEFSAVSGSDVRAPTTTNMIEALSVLERRSLNRDDEITQQSGSQRPSSADAENLQACSSQPRLRIDRDSDASEGPKNVLCRILIDVRPTAEDVLGDDRVASALRPGQCRIVRRALAKRSMRTPMVKIDNDAPTLTVDGPIRGRFAVVS
jgi:hypothetical protein